MESTSFHEGPNSQEMLYIFIKRSQIGNIVDFTREYDFMFVVRLSFFCN